jgi:hypothetical protein
MPALHRGDLSLLDDTPEDVLAYTRRVDGSQVLVVVNFGDNVYTLDLSASGGSARLLLSSEGAGTGVVDLVHLSTKPHESLLVELL